MPSARELLEQADALMRRNRSPLMDDIPVLTDSVPEVVRRRGAPGSLAGDMAGVVETEAPRGPDTIPMLTESVATEDDESDLAPASQPASPSAVTAYEGDASTWLRTGGEEPSVIGDAPDSIARVPEYEEEPPEEIVVEAPLEVEEAFDEELALRDAPLDAPPDAPMPEPAAPVLPEIEVEFEPEPEPVAEGPVIDEPVVEAVVAPPPVLAWEDDAPAIAAAAAAVAAPAFAIATSEPAPPAVDEAALKAAENARKAEEEARRAAEDARKAEEEARRAEEDARKAAEEARKAEEEEEARRAAEEARWASMAEEIRMQVLQRIDLFTDTGLRDQLGARLQPIVDRASADLVATINQHVGDLLRTYVAEAIEREIENWKSNTRGS